MVSRWYLLLALVLMAGLFYVSEEINFFESLVGTLFAEEETTTIGASTPTKDAVISGSTTSSPTQLVTLSPTSQSPTSKSPTSYAPSSLAPTSQKPTSASKKPTEKTNEKITESPTTGSPTTRAPTIPVAVRCMTKPVKSTRPSSPWNCSNTLTDLEDAEVRNESAVPLEILNKRVSLLRGGNWGQLCNKLGIFAGTLAKMRQYNQLDNIFALLSVHSETAWALDLEALSSRVPAVLMDCLECDDPPTQVRCSTIVIKGTIYDVSSRTFPLNASYWIGDMYWGARPRSQGFLPELVQSILPKKHLRNLVKVLIDKFHDQIRREDPNMKSIGVHRRYMDSMCYAWFSGGGQYNCFPSGEAGRAAAQYGKVRDGKFKKQYDATNIFRDASDELRAEVERAAPWTVTCNYTLNPTQIKLINATWPVITLQPWSVLLADDNQTPKGQKVFIESGWPKQVGNLQYMENPTCFADKKFHNMFADMLGMAMTDYHMGMVLSSCDDIVVHWRAVYGKANGTSFPTGCYDDYYRQVDKFGNKVIEAQAGILGG